MEQFIDCLRSLFVRAGDTSDNVPRAFFDEEKFRSKMAFSIQLPQKLEPKDEIELSGRINDPLQVFSINLTLGPKYKAIGYHLKIDYEKKQIIHDWRDSSRWQGAIVGNLQEYNLGDSKEFDIKFIFGQDTVQLFEKDGNHIHTNLLRVGLKNIKYLEVWEDTRQTNNQLIQIDKLNFKFASRD